MHTLPVALAALNSYPQFIPYLLVPSGTKPGKSDKLPVDWRTGQVTAAGSGGAHNAEVWLPYDRAAAVAELLGPSYGVGFVFTDACGMFFLDIDGCLQADGTWSPIAQHLCQAFAGAAIERSVSGTGLHIVGRASLIPPHGTRHSAHGLELYHTLRFMALGTDAVGDASTDHTAALHWAVQHFFPYTNGQHQASADEWRDGPVPEWRGPTDDAELIERVLSHRSVSALLGGGASPRDLWENNETVLAQAYPSSNGDVYDRSKADMALAQHLAYFTGRDHARMERLMLASGLHREKWDSRPEWLRSTILHAAGRQLRVLGGGATVAASGAVANLQTGNPPAVPSADTTGAAGGGTFAAAAVGVIPPTLVNLQAALLSPEAGVTLRYDAFLDRIMWDTRAITDEDYIGLRTRFEERGFKAISKDLMRDAVYAVAYARKFDSAVDWAGGLVWDCVPRVETSLTAYWGVPDGDYPRAVSRYLWTALAGRCLEPGCQADMAIIFVGLQGSRKTSGVKALTPTLEAYGTADLRKVVDDDGASARRVRGKLVLELGELKGLASADNEAIKEWVSRTFEAWTPKFVEHETRYQRRCVAFGTSNRNDLLSDTTGNRRWLPLRAGAVDVAGLQRDRDQLWAEAVALWRAQGVQWHDAERLARSQHEGFRRVDPWEDRIAEWLSQVPPLAPGQTVPQLPPGMRPVSVGEVLECALRINPAQIRRAEEMRAAEVLAGLGFESRQIRQGERVVRRWVATVATSVQPL